jgi:hypothetical protein
VCDTLSYGYAATSSLSCGQCYQLQFTGPSSNSSGDQGSQNLAGKTMIVQAINNGGVQSNQFDIMIPGGGVGANNACTANGAQWGSSADVGATYGGLLTECKQASADYNTYKSCVTQKCATLFASSAMSDLLAGCSWFVDWYEAADDPALTYTEVACPSAITSRSGLHN